MILDKLLVQNLEELETLIDKLMTLPNYECFGRTFEGINWNGKGVRIHSSTYFNGCGTEDFYYDIAYENLNQPIEWFRKDLQSTIDNHKNIIERAATEEVKAKLEQERKTYERLKQQFN